MADAPGPLARTLRRGAAYSALALGGTQAVALLQTLVIARLLTPAEIGGFAAGTVLTGLLTLFAEGGLRQALVQRADGGDLARAANTVFAAALLAGVLAAALALAAAPLIGAYFASQEAGRIAAATAGVLVLRAFTHVPDALMLRRFQFKRRLVIDPAVAVAFPLVAVPLCLAGAGAWGLVAGLYAGEVAWVVSSWWLSGWRPGGARPSVRLWREMARFSAPLVVGVAAERARQMLEVAVVGRLLGTAGLGLYRYGRRVGELPGTAVVEVGAYVLFPAFSRIADDAGRFRAAFLRALRALWTAAVPVAGLLLAVGGSAVVVLLGEPWRGAGPLLETMAGWGPGTALLAVGGEALKGAGATRRLYVVTAVGLVAGVGLLVALVPPLGLAGVGLTLSVTNLVAGALAVALARASVRISGREVLGTLWPALVAGLVATPVVALLEHGVLTSDRRPVAAGVGLLVVDAVVFALVYLVVLRLVDRTAVDGLVSALRARAGRSR